MSDRSWNYVNKTFRQKRWDLIQRTGKLMLVFQGTVMKLARNECKLELVPASKNLWNNLKEALYFAENLMLNVIVFTSFKDYLTVPIHFSFLLSLPRRQLIEYRSDDVTKIIFLKLWDLLRYSESTWWKMPTCQNSLSYCNLGMRYWPSIQILVIFSLF